eukprot:GHVS01099978.1.p1 GENE.GHVS01099978.1~~GHVS01099978.1.p1  ORF type:complete len:3586 (-),score=566.23 GHVS01099978.1:255-11012(-)
MVRFSNKLIGFIHILLAISTCTTRTIIAPPASLSSSLPSSATTCPLLRIDTFPLRLPPPGFHSSEHNTTHDFTARTAETPIAELRLLSSQSASSELPGTAQIFHAVVRSLEPRYPLLQRRAGGAAVPLFTPASSASQQQEQAASAVAFKPTPRSNGLDCMDNPMVEEFDTKCKLIARSLGGRLGCEKKLIDIAPDGMLPPQIPSYTSVADACPESCGLCEVCAPNCALWFIGNTMCDDDCNVPQCQFDGGDCWNADCVQTDWSDWSECSVTCGGRNRPGQQKRTRRIRSHPKNGGKPCDKTIDTKECYRDLCPLDCVVSEWSEWGDCSATCGEGTNMRTRTVLKDPDVNGAKCPPTTQSRRCVFDSCARDCVLGEWSDWKECTASCGGGAQTRRRNVMELPVNGGGTCPSLEEARVCNDVNCGSICEVGNWSSWTQCSATCGGGRRSRGRDVTRSSSMMQLDCPPLKEQEECNRHPCAVDCKAGEWQAWSSCSVSCGTGNMTRNRSITRPKEGAGKQCGLLQIDAACFPSACATDCAVEEWSEWSECSAKCGNGLQTRKRKPTVLPSDGGRGCPAIEELRDCEKRCGVECKVGDWGEWSSCSDMCQQHGHEQLLSYRSRPVLLETDKCPNPSTLMQTQSCAAMGSHCDVDCVLSAWSEWSGCSATCGGGNRNRQRRIETDRSGSGAVCSALVEDQKCGVDECPLEGQSVNCRLGEWSEWSQCDQTCGGGRELATRLILGFSSGDGTGCGESERIKEGCNPQPCARDCIVTGWSEWSSCDATCGGGDRRRSRSLVTKEAGGGKACPATEQNQKCAIYPCPTDCQLSEWGAPSPCSVACGEGTNTRTRRIVVPASTDPPGLSCGPVRESLSCVGGQGACDRDCRLSAWSPWSKCSADCGGGMASRERTVEQPPVGLGKQCPKGGMQEYKTCNAQACASDCVVGSWSLWGDCSISCSTTGGGGGTRERSRPTLRLPSNGGAPCPPTTEVDDTCNTNVPCPVECMYTPWSEWSVCRASCGVGQKSRVRRVQNADRVRPSQCGDTEDSTTCLADRLCVQDCKAGEWNEWNDCSVTCGGGLRTRSRRAVNLPANGGRGCPPLDDHGECSTQSCDGMDCEVSEWSEWSACSKADCGGGVEERTRIIITPATGGGEECPPRSELSHVRGCNMRRCPGPCKDNKEVADNAGVSCEVLAAQGCDTLLKALAEQNDRPFPPGIPPETRVRDGCPVACDVCKECAPGCQLRDIGQRFCDEACNNERCQMDLGDCGGDCALPALPTGVVADPPAEAMVADQTVTVSCSQATHRFVGIPAVRKMALTCTGEGEFVVQPSQLKLKRNGNELAIPICDKDPCPYISISGFSREEMNGLYTRGDAAAGYPRYVQWRGRSKTNAEHHLWASEPAKGSDTFIWRLTPFAPSNPTKEAGLLASTTGPKCVLAETVGMDLPLNCADMWQVGVLNGEAVGSEKDVQMNCITETEKNNFLETKKKEEEEAKGEVGVEEPLTKVYGQWATCGDRPEVEELGGGKTCGDLVKLCSLLLTDTGAELPDFLPQDTTIAGVCPETCGLCETCGGNCPLWFKGNGHCDEVCNNAECEFDGGDCEGTTVGDTGGGGGVIGVIGDDGGDSSETISEPKPTTKPLDTPVVVVTDGEVDPRTDCEDDERVKKSRYNCKLLRTVAESEHGGCTAKLVDLSDDGSLPEGVPPITRVMDACPKTCEACNDPSLLVAPKRNPITSPPPSSSPPHSSTPPLSSGNTPPIVPSADCEDNPAVEAASGYTCARVVEFVEGDCDRLLSDLSNGTSPDGMGQIPANARLRDACPASCGVCDDGKGQEECINDPRVEAQGHSCDEIVKAVGCGAKLADLSSDPLPEGVAPDSKVQDACPVSCGTCSSSSTSGTSGSGGVVCVDDKRVTEMDLSCELFVQYAKEGCEVTTLADLVGEARTLADGLKGSDYVAKLCPASCMMCPEQQTECEDNPKVEEMNLSCSLLMGLSDRGCQALLKELSSEPLPAGIPANAKVADACRKSCGCDAPPTCDDGAHNGGEDGVDCGGLCRPCQGCSAAKLKALSHGYVLTGSGVTHGSTRQVACEDTLYEEVNGRSSEEVVCLDGKFSDPKIKCVEKRVSVLYGRLQLTNAADMGPETVPSIYTALSSSLSIRPPEELRLLSMGAESSIGVNEAPKVCEDNEAIAKGTGVSCAVLAGQFGCSTLLKKLAEQNGKDLPANVPEDTQVADACPLTCGLCTARRRRRLGASSNDLHISFAILSPHSDVSPIELRFTEDLPTHFLEQLGVQFITRNVRLPPVVAAATSSTVPAAEALRARGVSVAIEEPSKKQIPQVVWEEAYHGGQGGGGKNAAKKVFSTGGLLLPTQDSVLYVQPGDARERQEGLGSTVWMQLEGGVGQESIEVAVAPIVASVAGKCESLFSSKDPGSCCGMREEFQKLLEGNCGSLLYVQTSADNIDEFCADGGTSSCLGMFQAVVDKYDNRGGGACELVHFGRRIVESWCSQDHEETYCFNSIDSSNASVDMQELVTKASSELDMLCAVDSCYRHHLRYFDALTQLQVGWDISERPAAESLTSGSARTARSLGAVTPARGALSRHLGAAARAAQNAGRGLRRGLGSAAKVMGLSGEENEDSVVDRFLEERGIGAIEGGNRRRLINMHTMEGPLGDSSEDLLNVVCTKVDGDYCQQTLLLLTEESPIKNPTLVVQPCASRCFVPITGQLGGIVESFGERTTDPYYRALGAIMRGYGRYYCTQNEQGRLCGEFLFNKIKKVKVDPYLPGGVSTAMPQCRCQQSFLQDGECDADCFTEGCGWDGEDCLVRRMFPEVFVALTTIVDSQCLFYSTNFECTPKCRAQYETAKSVQGQGCCLSAALDVIGSMLKVQAEHPLLVSQNSWQPDRSVAYLEQMCGASFDRTCSGGRPRTVVTVEVEVDNLQAARLDRGVMEEIKKELRHSMAQYIRILDADVVRSVARPLLQGLNVRMEIDAGQQAERVKAQLTNTVGVDRLTALMSRRLGALPLRKYRSASNRPIAVHINRLAVRAHKSVSWPLSLIEEDPAPPVPYVGTWGVSGIAAPLRLKACEFKDIMELGPGYNVNRPSGTGGELAEPVHGTSRIARCARGYESFQGPNPDELVCDNGRWILSGHLDCRKSCTTDPHQKYKVTDGYRLRGDGLRHGSYRSIECAKGFAPVERPAGSASTIYCRDGGWTEPDLVCKATCPSFPGLGQAYNVVGVGANHGSSRVVSCNPHYHATPGPPSGPSQAVVTCEDGVWTKLSMQCIPAKTPPPESSKSAFEMILTQIFSDKGKTIVIITLVMVLVLAIAIFLAWRFYFRGRAKQNLADREQKVEQLKRSKGMTGMVGGGGGGGLMGGRGEAPSSPGASASSPGDGATYADTPSTVYIQNPASRHESIPNVDDGSGTVTGVNDLSEGDEDMMVNDNNHHRAGEGALIIYDHPIQQHNSLHHPHHFVQHQLASQAAPHGMFMSERGLIGGEAGPHDLLDRLREQQQHPMMLSQQPYRPDSRARELEDEADFMDDGDIDEGDDMDAGEEGKVIPMHYRREYEDLEHCSSPYSALQQRQEQLQQFNSRPHGTTQQ